MVEFNWSFIYFCGLSVGSAKWIHGSRGHGGLDRFALGAQKG